MAGLTSKRIEAALLLVGAALATGTASAAPTPVLEIPKQLAIVGGDVLVMVQLGRIYFRDFDEDELSRVLQHLVTAGAVGALAGYGATKLIEALAAEGLNLVPLAGWAISGVVTASVTGLVGGLFWLACDRAFRSGSWVGTELALLLVMPELSPEARAE
jgi:uncharacterized protein (DUF697 family)